MIGLWLGLAFLSGVLAHDLGLALAAAVTAVAGAALVSVVWPTRHVRLAAMAALVCLLAGAARVATAPSPATLPPDVAGRHRFTGVVLNMPRAYPERTDALLRLRSPVEATVLARLPPTVTVRQGDVLSGTGELAVAERVQSRSGGVATLRVSDFNVEGSEATSVQRLRTRAHEAIGERVLRSVAEPAATLTLGVLLGDDSRMTGPTRQAFQAAGLTHLTAVSGWNVAVVTGVCELGLRRWLSVRRRLPVVAGIIWSYAYLVGLQPPVVRAALMASLYLAARWRGRPRDPVTALLWSVVAMIAVEPAIRFDVAFQLSALSTAALALLGPQIARYPAWIGAIVLPGTTRLAVSPLLLHWFGAYSLVAPVANLLVGPAVAPVMAGGVLVAAASLAHPVAADTLGVLAWLPGRWVVWVAEVAARVPGLAGRTLSPSADATVLVYLGVGVPILWWWHRTTAVPLPEGLLLLAPEAAELGEENPSQREPA
uniref:ComEC/Rec2 family competence protein n=1 Tax=Thermorudis peleae TaxID=1382356 RepID=A0A831TDS7_9BACT